jgi:hypothetical protein
VSILSLKPNSRKTAPLNIAKTTKTTKSAETEWTSNGVGILVHESGFSIQFFNDEECEIINIPKDMSVATIRELSAKAMAVNLASSCS